MRNPYLFMLMLFASAPPFYAQQSVAGIDIDARRREIAEEASPELFSISLYDADVSLFLTGFWKNSVQINWGLSKNQFGWSIAQSDAPILFTQEADLTLSLWIKERWFVETNFREGHDINTYRAGYQGREGDFVRYAGVGNTGLDFPLFPYLDLGGDSVSSLGFYGAFGDGPLSLHTLFRYDAAEREERVFTGGRERTYTPLSVAAVLRGVSFVLPDINIAELPVVYFEDNDGSLSGGGRRWRLARPSEAAVSARDGLVELIETPKGMVAVSYPGGYSLGSYGDPSLSVLRNGFLGEVQDFFPDVTLASYPQPGGRTGETAPAIITIDGVQALAVFEKGTFSPFERQSRYMAPASNTASAALVYTSTKEVVRGWDVFKFDQATAGGVPLYVNEDNSDVYNRDIYQISRSGEQNIRSPRARWPLAQNEHGNPWLIMAYLSGKDASDIQLRFTNYSSQAGYNIGKDVISGSIQVMRGGISDPYWSFDELNGTVRLQMPAQAGEIVRISYLRRSLDRQNGSIAVGLGAVYKDSGPISARGALGVRWNASNESYSSQGVTSPGIAGFGGKVSWDYGSLNADISLGAGYEQPDTTGLYRVSGMEGHENIFELPDSSFISNPASLETATPPEQFDAAVRAPLVYRNYKSTSITGAASLLPIEYDAPIITYQNGPYPARDNQLNARVLAAEFELDGVNKKWSGFQSQLPDGNALAQAEKVLIPFRFYDTAGAEGLDIYVQFGPLAAKNSSVQENAALIVEKQLDIVPAGSDPQIAQIELTNDDRRKLQGATYMRVLLVINSGAATQPKGRVLFAPPVFMGAAFTPLVASDSEILDNLDPSPVSAVETTDITLAQKYPDIIKRLHPSGEKQRVLNVSWDSPMSWPGYAAGAGGRVGGVPLSNYKTLSFFVKIQPPASFVSGGAIFEFYVTRGKSSYKKSGETALEARIPVQTLVDYGGESWVKVELRYSGEETGVFAGGTRIAGAKLDYHGKALLKNGTPASEEEDFNDDAYVMFFLRPENSFDVLNRSFFSVDEIILEEGNSAYYINSGFRLKWNHTGALIQTGSLKIVENCVFETALETAARGNLSENTDNGFAGAVNRSHTEATVFGTRLYGDMAFSLRSDSFGGFSWWTAGHGVSRSFGPLTLGERFFTDSEGGLWTHSAGAGFTGAVDASFDVDGRFQDAKTERAWRSSAGVKNIAGAPLSVSVAADWRWSDPSAGNREFAKDYGEIWALSWNALVPDAGAGASVRTMRGKFDARLAVKPVGAGIALSALSEAAIPAGKTVSGGRAEFDFPWTAGTLNGGFRMERKYERSVAAVRNSAAEDFREFHNSFTGAGAILGVIPFYALFDKDLSSKLDDVLAASGQSKIISGGLTGDLYSLSVRFPAQDGVSALYLPREADIHVDRNIIRRLDTMQDILGIGGNMQFSALNIFGAFGAARLFDFYQNDEFRHNIGAAAAFPKNDLVSWRINAGQNAVFYGFQGAELHTGSSVTVLSTGWIYNFVIEWLSPAEKSFLGALYETFMGRFQNSAHSPALSSIAAASYDRMRREKLRFDIDNSSEISYYAVQAGHESIIKIIGRLELIAFMNMTYLQNGENPVSSFIAAVGLSLQVQF